MRLLDRLLNRVESSSPRRTLHHATFERVLGTFMEIQVSHGPSVDPEAIDAVALRVVSDLERTFSAYDGGSELSVWNNSFEEPVPVSADLAEVLSLAETWRVLTRGAFHPMAGNGAELDSSAPFCHVDPVKLEATKLTKASASLNAIAKGFHR